MIDAEEAEARTQRAAEEQARREEAEARALRVAEEHTRREKAEAQARLAAEEQASREDVAPTVAHEPELDAVAAVAHAELEHPVPAQDTPPAVVEDRWPDPEPDADPHEAAEDLPVYAWLERVLPKERETADWTRELVKARETRGD
jgi:hypothetical protein